MNKTEILNLVQEKISEKIRNLERLISETRESNNETKSSMGDKYETGREMVQQEINNLQIQLNENMKSETLLKTINPVPHKTVGFGSIVETEKGRFFIAVSLGEITFSGEKIFVISTESPLAKAMHGKKEGEKIIVNGLAQSVLGIW
ncbi:GreA/GreB family elongation factor [Chryseobacterium suipulveris]|uniref:GreA/GreB family elongation factor n=1 Tax=Chryseobacterium suipulveris TaxID=2929800 RepID=A0ABY4BMJ9_9FLAO|nr:GreA/GreB family elongation factor [Chryseobacterium suipulveris]UOE40414.1 GreA/GreB family elongation factor [Chryseobacterium suipulveris]